MTKLITKVMFLILMTSKLLAEDLPRIQMDVYDHVSKATSVVEVLGNSRGSGVLVIMDGNIVIVTNSHNLQGKSSAMINLPVRFVHYFILQPIQMKSTNLRFQGMSKVMYDFPLSDVAILEFPEVSMRPEDRAMIYQYAYSNGVLSAKKGWEPGNRSIGFGDTVSAVLQGQASSIKALEGYKGSSVPDRFISGDDKSIWAIPIYGKPGFSGGAYYRSGVLAGLVTKINLAGEPVAFATPFSKVAKLIYTPNDFEKNFSWENELMIYRNNDRVVSVNPLGNGWFGNGGDLLEVDDTISGDNNPNYWRLEVHTAFTNRIVTTWDPFAYRPGHFKVNDENVGFIRVKGKTKNSDLFSIPSLASFLYSERKGEKQTFMRTTPLNLAVLKEARLTRKNNINYGRLYTRDYKDNAYKIYNLRYSNVNGAQLLKPMSDKRWAPKEKYNRWSGPKPILEMDADVVVDNEGYFSNIPFSTKISDKNIFDVKVPGSFLKTQSMVYLSAPNDLSQVVLRIGKGNESSEIILKPVEFNSPNSLVFKSDDGAHRVIYMYANNDLTKLCKIYFETENTLMEFWTSEI